MPKTEPRLPFFRKSTRGAGVAEYGILAALVAVTAISAVSQMGSDVDQTYASAADRLHNSPPWAATSAMTPPTPTTEELTAGFMDLATSRCLGNAWSGAPLDTSGLTRVSEPLASEIDPQGRPVWSQNGTTAPFLIDTHTGDTPYAECKVSFGSDPDTLAQLDGPEMDWQFAVWVQDQTTTRTHVDTTCEVSRDYYRSWVLRPRTTTREGLYPTGSFMMPDETSVPYFEVREVGDSNEEQCFY